MAVENIVGGALNPDIITQLKRRQELLGQIGSRNTDNLLYLSNKNCWIKMTSFTEIVGKDSIGIVNRLFDNQVYIERSTDLAKNWTLSGGIVTNFTSKDGLVNATMRYGVDPVHGAYGPGGTSELGYRPMPGIQSLHLESLPPVGAVYSATIKIKAWNLNQLSVLDMLYFRLGYYCLVEWGHSVFVDNKGHVHTDIFQPIDTQKPGITTADIQDQIKTIRKRSGYNYDAMIGLVSNYDWTQNKDGSYDCTVKLTGLGSLAESLKINSQANMPQIIPIEGSPATSTQTVSTPPDSALKAFLVNIKNFTQKYTTVNQKSSNPYDIMFQEVVRQCFASSNVDLLSRLNPNAEIGSLDDLATHGFSKAYVKASNTEKLTLRDKIRPLKIEDFVTYTTLSIREIVGTDSEKSKVATKSYIPLSLLLAYINNSCLLYSGPESKGKPLQYIDFHPDTSTCLRVPPQLSTDPSVCIVDTSNNGQDFADLFTRKGVAISEITNPITNSTGNTVNDKITATGLSYLHATTSAKTKSPNSSVYIGNTLNIFVNVDYLISVYDNQLSKDQKTKNVNLSDYIDEILKGINTALGGINQLKLLPDGMDPHHVFSIIENQMQDYNEEVPTINVFGLQNQTVRDFSLKTNASTQYGSALAITAMHDSSEGAINDPTGANIDTSGILGINGRLRNRLAINDAVIASKSGTTSYDQAAKDQAAKAQSDLVALANGVNNFLAAAYGFTNHSGELRYVVDNVAKVQNYYLDALLKIKNGTGVSADHVTANGVLPLELNMTLDGIGGIPLFEAFTIPSSRLPIQYLDSQGKQLVGFTVYGISHTIESNQWTTSIRGGMINLPSGSRIAPPNPAPKVIPPPSDIGTHKPASNYKKSALYNDANFRAKLKSICAIYQINEDDVLRVMFAESGLDPKGREWNLYHTKKSTGQKYLFATGLLQYTPDNVGKPGSLFPNLTLEQISVLPAYASPNIAPKGGPYLDQLDLANQYFDTYKKTLTGGSIFVIYGFTFFPSIVKDIKSGNDSKVIEASGLPASLVSQQNPAIAKAAGKRVGDALTVGDFKKYVSSIV
jgi:hypothetical protein